MVVMRKAQVVVEVLVPEYVDEGEISRILGMMLDIAIADAVETVEGADDEDDIPSEAALALRMKFAKPLTLVRTAHLPLTGEYSVDLDDTQDEDEE